jgi:hypothetical protein
MMNNDLVEVPDPVDLENFKQQVRTWVELDSSMKKLQAAIKERRSYKKMLTDKILAFMDRYNIEDLNTKEGRLRYNVVYVKPALSQKDIKSKLEQYFASDAVTGQNVVSAVFETSERLAKVNLKRLKA